MSSGYGLSSYIDAEEVRQQLAGLGHSIARGELEAILLDLGFGTPHDGVDAIDELYSCDRFNLDGIDVALGAGGTSQPERSGGGAAACRTAAADEFAQLAARLDELEAQLGTLERPASLKSRAPVEEARADARQPRPARRLPSEEAAGAACDCAACAYPSPAPAPPAPRSRHRDEVRQLQAYAAGVWPEPEPSSPGPWPRRRRRRSDGSSGASTAGDPEEGALRLVEGRAWRRSDPVTRYQ